MRPNPKCASCRGAKDAPAVDADEHIEQLVANEHQATIDYVKTPIGTSDVEMSTYFVAAGDTTALALVNDAQRDYVEKYIKANMPQLAGVAGACRPHRRSRRGFGGARDYTDVPPGPLAINNAADLYLYPNTITAVKIDGAGVKAWLEKSAEWFNHIDPSKSEPQELINKRVPTYNFDVIQGGLSYTIDVTKAPGQRIDDLKLNGKPLAGDQPVIVVTNNYRASGGGKFPESGWQQHRAIGARCEPRRVDKLCAQQEEHHARAVRECAQLEVREDDDGGTGDVHFRGGKARPREGGKSAGESRER